MIQNYINLAKSLKVIYATKTVGPEAAGTMNHCLMLKLQFWNWPEKTTDV